MKRLIAIILAAMLAISCSAAEIVLPGGETATPAAAGAAGSATDPVISKSYLESTIIPKIESEVGLYIDAQLGETYWDYFYRACQIVAGHNLSLKQSDIKSRESAGSVRLKKGDKVTLALGSSFVVDAGTGFAVGELSNVTAGTTVNDGDYLPTGQSCMSSGEGRGLLVESDTMQLTIQGAYSIEVSSNPDYNSAADALYTMGLFKGDSSGYALERAATRTEGLVMFIRLLGEEDEALAYTGSHPFTDVDTWADCYVAYAYNKGYTKGISDTLFGATNPIAARDYMTFLLRALGYSESADFQWSTAVSDGVSLGLINFAEATIIEESFFRCHVVYVSYYALFAKLSGGGTLLEKLENDGSVRDVVQACAKITGQRVS